jgi:hypothetical protein
MRSPKTHPWSWFFSPLERGGQPLAPPWLFIRRLAVNVGIALVVVLGSLGVGMLGYRYLEGLSWLRSFGHAAMILGGMGPYDEPTNDGSKLFEGVYALYAGLLLIGMTGLILSPVFHRVMHQLNLPDESEVEGDKAKPKPKPKSKARPKS